MGSMAPLWGADEEDVFASGAASPGWGLRLVRARVGLTLAAAAQAAGVSASTLSRFERGLHAPRGITAIGDTSDGAAHPDALAITSVALAQALGFATAAGLTRACSRAS